MSKSLGNGIDPMDVIEKYGADALRWFLSNGSAPGQDVRFSYEKWMLLGTLSIRSGMQVVSVIMNVEGMTAADIDFSGEKDCR